MVIVVLSGVDAGDYSGASPRSAPAVSSVRCACRSATSARSRRGPRPASPRAPSRSPRGIALASTSSDCDEPPDRVAASGEPPREREQRHRHGGQPCLDAERAGDRPRRGPERPRRRVGDAVDADGCDRRIEHRVDRRRRDCRRRAGCAASRIAPSGSDASPRDGVDEGEEVALHARPVDERQAQHDRGERGARGDGGQPLARPSSLLRA